MTYPGVLRQLGHLGEIRVATRYEKNGIQYIQFREKTLVEWFKEKFLRDSSEIKKAREDVVAALTPLIRKSLYPDQLTQNIQDRYAHDKGISGRALKRDYQPVEAGKRPMPLRGGTIAAISRGNSVQIIQANPAKVKCNHAVLRTSTAIAEASRNPQLKNIQLILEEFKYGGITTYSYPNDKITPRAAEVPIRVTNTPLSVGVMASSWSCVTDLQLPELHSNEASISENKLKESIKKAIGVQTGSVVVEVIPDKLEEHGRVSNYAYTETGLRSQIQVARELVAEAKKNKRDLVITFACEDTKVLERMKKLAIGEIQTS